MMHVVLTHVAHCTSRFPGLDSVCAGLRIFTTTPRDLQGVVSRARMLEITVPLRTTSAGLVLVARAFFCALEVEPVAVFTIPVMDEKTPPYINSDKGFNTITERSAYQIAASI